MTESKNKTGKYCRTRGHSWEREVAKLFREFGYPQARRHLEYHKADAKGYDLDNTGEWLVQCKRNKGYAPINKIFEVEDWLGKKPVLVTKADHKPAMAVMALSDFLDLIYNLKTETEDVTRDGLGFTV